MILKGLPDSYKPFAIHITQSAGERSFTEFKSQLKSFEETEKFNAKSKADQVMKAVSPSTPTCYGCGRKGQLIKECWEKREPSKWCSYHKSTNHMDSECIRQQRQQAKTKQATSRGQTETTNGEHSFLFHVKDLTVQHQNNTKGLLVNTGAASHIITTDSFTSIDGTFKPTEHYMELADGTMTKNIAVKRGDAEVVLKDMNGRHEKTVLKGALFIPSYPQDIFSVKVATSNGAELKFHRGQNELVHKDGTRFPIKEHNQLYFLNTVEQCDNTCDKISVSYDIHTWHEILGHCNHQSSIIESS